MLEILQQWYRRHFTDPQTVIFAFILLIGGLLVFFLSKHLMPILVAIILAYLNEGLVVWLGKIKGAVEAGMGITIMSRSIIGKELKLGTLAAVQLEPPLSRPFSFVRQRQKFRVTVLEELLEFAQAYFEKNG